MTRYEVYYSRSTGFGEPARTLLEYAGAEWSDKHPENWETEKHLTPYGKLPVLIEHGDDGKVVEIVESDAIYRYLARKFGLYGQDIQEDVQQDTIISQWKDVLAPAFLTIQNNEHVKQYGTEKAKEASQHLFEKHGELLKKNGTGHYVGNRTTLADIFAYSWLKTLKKIGIVGESFPHQEDFDHFEATLASDPKFKRYLDRAEVRCANYKF
ncbi:Glutathione S-transferase A2 [Dispira parvispora]|uniref:Glutathione S-transferase A2 n=1 Tax=Dispira parvispora TaxID=1520584 RepID=A0A9W8ARC8_9FUNG|nr:Glutathione S-transferase A2 [Dispira parvispora]